MSIDQYEFIGIYDKYAPKIFTYCFFRVGSKEDAEDIASKVFLKTWDYLLSGKDVDNMQAFLYKTAGNLVIDYYRTSKRNKEISIEQFGVTLEIPEEATFVEAIDKEIALTEVMKHIQCLPDNYREVILLRFMQDMSVPEIAEATGVSENNVSVRLHRAIEKLKQIATEV
ncbi:MAG: RNA polymerase sigma factor [Parcubacteria group bacterium]